MKTLKTYIGEAFRINKNTRIVKSKYPDNLNYQNYVMWESDDTDSYDYDDFIEILKGINHDYDHFLCTRFVSLSESENLLEDIIEHDLDLLELIDSELVTGKDAGYEVRMNWGHIEVDCINSGSRATYYIYAIDDHLFEICDEIFTGDDDDLTEEDLGDAIFKDKKHILEITE